MDQEQTATQTSAAAGSAESVASIAESGRSGWVWDVLWLALIVVGALVLRLLYLHQFQHNPYFSDHVMDPKYHHDWAKAFASGERFWDGPYFRAPLYPWFLGVIYKLFGADNAMAPRVVQAVIGSLSCGLLYLVGRSIFSRAAGAIAGVMAATYWIFIYYDAELLIPVLIVFLDLALLWLLVIAGRRRSPALWGVAGVVMGVSALARPNILLLAPALVVWIFVLHWRKWGRSFGYALCLFVGTILPILPVTIRNYVVGDDLVLIASQGGVNFYIGNNPNSDGMSAIIKGDPGEWWDCYNAQIKRAELAERRQLKASEVSRWYSRQTWRFMWEQPRAAGTLLLDKLGYFWSNWEVSNNQDIRFMTHYYAPVVERLPVRFWLIGPLGVLGLLIAVRRGKELFPLWGFVLIYMISIVMFFVTARYRVPVAAVLMLLGGHAVCWWFEAIEARRWRSLVGGALVLVAMGFVAARTPPKVDKLMVQEHRETGIFLVHKEDWEQGERLLSELIRRAPEAGRPVDAEAWYYLGYARVKLEEYAAAIDAFEHALVERPVYPEARSNLAYAFIATNHPYAAMEQFERIIANDPDNVAARVNLANGLAQLGQIDRASVHILRAIELDSANARELLAIAQRVREGGDARGAQRLLEAGRERFPNLIQGLPSPD